MAVSHYTLTSIVMAMLGFGLVACQKHTASDIEAVQVPKPPFSNAGADQVFLLPKDSVTLNGSGSVDPDGNIVDYQWTQLSGPGQVILTNARAEITSIRGFVEGYYFFQLRVTDDNHAVSNDTVEIRFLNQLKGLEYNFRQAWGSNDGTGADNDVYVSTTRFPDLFSLPTIPVEVSLQLDSPTDWINVPKYTTALPVTEKYFFLIRETSLDVYASYPGSASQLIGKGVNVKIKFL